MPIPAATEQDPHVCAFIKPVTPPIPHVGGPVTVKGKRTVKINGKKAATFGDVGECLGHGSPEPKDAIIGGYLKTFINGNPVAHTGSVTFGGTVTATSSNTFYMGIVTVLAEAAANWLNQYLAQQPHIPFQHAQDGCYARAHEMSRMIKEQFGIDVKKKFVYGNLQPATGAVTSINPYTGALESSSISWGYHVAPTVPGVNAMGVPTQYVIDPSLGGKSVLTADEWIDLSKGSGTVSAIKDTPADVYYTSADGSKVATDPGYADSTKDNAQRTREVAAGEKTDPDPNLASKISPKKSLPPPVVPVPHLP